MATPPKKQMTPATLSDRGFKPCSKCTMPLACSKRQYCYITQQMIPLQQAPKPQ